MTPYHKCILIILEKGENTEGDISYALEEMGCWVGRRLTLPFIHKTLLELESMGLVEGFA